MATKSFKPTSPGRRSMTVSTFEEITRKEPEKSLTSAIKRKGGRNNQGRQTIRHQGGGHKRKYRIIDFKRDKDNVPAKVAHIEYDPNRSARIALLNYVDGEKRYIIAPVGLRLGQEIISGSDADIVPGNAKKLRDMPLGTVIHNVELKPGKGGQLARSAGSSAQVMAKEGKYAQIRLPSGEVRMILLECKATVGQVGNVEHETISIGKAGRNRWLGIRPGVRGSAMNAVDHPHGGGEGRTSIGRASPMSPWGKKTLGKKTRKPKKSDQYIVRKRRKKK